jgi:hypothetical protein
MAMKVLVGRLRLGWVSGVSRAFFGLLVLVGAAGVPAVVPVAAYGLPDGRVYEMVTPPENDDADVYVPNVTTTVALLPGEDDIQTLLPFQAAADGDAFVYVGDSTAGGTGETGGDVGNEYLATRSPMGGWTQVNLQPLADRSVFYQAFSSDLADGVVQQGSVEEQLLSAEAPAGGYKILYTHSLSDGSGGSYRPFFTVTPPNRAPVGERSSEFQTASFPGTTGATPGIVAFVGGSVGLDVGFFEGNDALTVGAVDGGPEENNLYASAGGRLGLVNVLPGGGSEANATFGARSGEVLPNGLEALPDLSHVVSDDGSQVFWTDLNTGDLYVSEGAGGGGWRSVEVDESQNPGAPEGGGGRFWTASEDGSRVFFTDGRRLTPDSTAVEGAPDLYEYEVESGQLVDLTVDGGGHADVEGVLGDSEDGSYVYFTAKGMLAGNANGEGMVASAGGSNLYVWHEGLGVRFITTLSSDDSSDWIPGVGYRTAQVTPSGGSLVFMSNDQSVEGYSPESGGSRVQAVYVYEYRSDRLSCASCDTEYSPSEVSKLSRLGSFLPVSWSATYLPDWMSEDGGRVFFDSTLSLVPGDTNGKPDVYEWEREGTGSCEESKGCLFLLSNGVSTSASWLAGESANGNDVFVISRAPLAPEDDDETYNLFDARVGGVQPVSEPECTGTGCQGLLFEQPVFATPAGVTFRGVGNFLPAEPTANQKTVKKKGKRKKGNGKVKARVKAKGKGRAKAGGAVRVRRGVHGVGDR